MLASLMLTVISPVRCWWRRRPRRATPPGRRWPPSGSRPAAAARPPVDVDLSWSLDPDGPRGKAPSHCVHGSTLWHRGPGSKHATAPAAPMLELTRSSDSSCRVGFGDSGERHDVDLLAAGLGSMPAARRQPSASAALPAQPASAARSVLRRWAKAASMTAKTCSRVAVVTGGSRRVNADEPGIDLGRGPEDVHADDAGLAHAAVPGGLDGGHAVGLVAGPGRHAVGDLVLHHDQAVLQPREVLEQVQHHGHGHVVGKIRHQRGGSAGSSVTFMASARTTWKFPAACGRNSATVGGRRAARTGSISTATTRAGGVQQAKGQRPEAGADLQHGLARPGCRRRPRCGGWCFRR